MPESKLRVCWCLVVVPAVLCRVPVRNNLTSGCLDSAPVLVPLDAPNGYLFRVTPSVIDEMQALWETQVRPALDAAPSLLTGSVVRLNQSGAQLYVRAERSWGDMLWLSSQNSEAYQIFAAAYARSGLEHEVGRLLSRGEPHMYSGFFVSRKFVRPGVNTLHWDFRDTGTNAFTILIPLLDHMESYFPGSCHLTYVTSTRQQRIHRYRRGEAVILGDGLWHGPQACDADTSLPLLNFVVASDDTDFSPIMQEYVFKWARSVWHPRNVQVTRADQR